MKEPSQKERETVEMMVGYGIPENDIARVMRMSNATLRRWFAEELETGLAKMNSRVAESLFLKALGTGTGAVTACIFWLKCRARWVEPAPAEGYVGKKEQLQRAAKLAEAGTGWTEDLDTEVRAN